MKIVVCIDDKNGMLFNKRRQSKDRLLREDMLEFSQDRYLWMNEYSAAQFTESADHIRIDEEFLEKASDDEFCLVENSDIAPYADRTHGVIIYRWNRTYPSDVKFPAELFSDRWKLVNVYEFAGSSHELITREEYSL